LSSTRPRSSILGGFETLNALEFEATLHEREAAELEELLRDMLHGVRRQPSVVLGVVNETTFIERGAETYDAGTATG